ncbi:MAG: antitoxin VbhA family protein [Oscillospiraceae bacterium]|nr:antitoxin VbhA family protein [Oscillospiraceae bacterium]
MSEREYEALRSALASTRMEGFRVTEQTEKDCIRLMSGEVSVSELVKEILARPVKAV